VCALVGLLVSGCSGMGTAENSNARTAATQFYRSLTGDPVAACAALAPGTRQELEGSFGPCRTSLDQQQLPDAKRVLKVSVYGKNAMVELDEDVIFLARFAKGWRVTAAGCRPQGNRPYDCVIIKGG
jgi:hypothetical protein